MTPLIKEIQQLSTPIISGQRNAITWTNDLVRILHLETLSTATSRSPLVQAEDTNHTLTVAVALLKAGVARRRQLAGDPSIPAEESARLMQDVEVMMLLVEAIEKGQGPAKSDWHDQLTWIVGRRAIITEEGEPWMDVRHAIEGP